MSQQDELERMNQYLSIALARGAELMRARCAEIALSHDGCYAADSEGLACNSGTDIAALIQAVDVGRLIATAVEAAPESSGQLTARGMEAERRADWEQARLRGGE